MKFLVLGLSLVFVSWGAFAQRIQFLVPFTGIGCGTIVSDRLTTQEPMMSMGHPNAIERGGMSLDQKSVVESLFGVPAMIAADLMASPKTIPASKMGEIPPIRPEHQNRKRAVRVELDDGRVVNLPLYRHKDDVYKVGRRVRLHYHSVLDSILLFDGPARDASSYARLCSLESAVTKEQADRIISLSQNLEDEALIAPEPTP
jgi:hypothetical protein